MESFADSFAAPMSVINAFIVALSMRKKDEVKEVFERLENMWTNMRFTINSYGR